MAATPFSRCLHRRTNTYDSGDSGTMSLNVELIEFKPLSYHRIHANKYISLNLFPPATLIPTSYERFSENE